MPFATIKRWLRDDAKPRTSKPAGLHVDRLDDRIVPAAGLFDLNNSFLGGANQPSNILGMSDDGRYVIFESKATDLIVGQQDIPGTNDLFWRDLQTSETRMVTALPTVTSTGYDFAATRLSPSSFALLGVTDGVVRPSFKTAVISGDGSAVAFSSVINAARLDEDVANTKYLPVSGVNVVTDQEATLDVFRWSAFDGRLNLASRTLSTAASKQVLAVGRFSSADIPAINTDGNYIGYVSAIDAGYINNTAGPTNGGGPSTGDSGSTFDVFVTRYERDLTNKVSYISGTVVSAFGNVFDQANGMPHESFTYGSQAGGTGVSVDPQGRYISQSVGGAVFITFTAPVTGFFGTGTAGKSEAYRIQIEGSLTGDLTSTLITDITGASGGGGGGFGGTGITTNGGNAQNIIIARNNPNAMIVSASTGTGNNGVYNPFPQASKTTRQDLYYVRTDLNSPSVTVLNNQRIPSTAASATVADTTQYGLNYNGKYLVYSLVEGVQVDGITDKTQVFYRQVLPTIGAAQRISVGLDGQPLAEGANTPRLSPNGRFVTYASTTLANLVVDATITDANNASDVFIRDLYATQNPANPTLFIARTQLLSINSTGLATSNGASTNAFVGTSNVDPLDGVSPSTANDSVGRAVFNSSGTNIDLGFPVLHTGNSSYEQDLPIGGLPPINPPTDAPRTGVLSGGRDAAIAQVTFTGAGTVVIGQRLTPYPGFTGEIRVASADFNGDGILDTAVAPGAGLAPRILVFNGANDKVLYDFFGYEIKFLGGVNIAAADMNGDGRAELVLGADKGGGARVRVLDLANSKTLADYFAYNSDFRGGVRVATGDFDGDGVIDVLTGAGSGGGPRVTVFSGKSLVTDGTINRFIDFFAMDLNLRDGVFVAGGDFNNDGVDDIVVGAGAGGGPRVRVFESVSVRLRPSAPDLLYDFFASDPKGRAGVRVAVKNVDGDDIADIVTGNGFGSESRIRTFSGSNVSGPLTPTQIDNSFVLFNDLTSLNGAWVG